MNCEEIKHLLSLYIDEQLDETERLKVEAHLESCAECKAHYESLLKLQQMADDFEPGGNENYWMKQKDAILDKIERAEADNVTPLPAKKSHALMYRVLAVAATITLVAMISIFELKYDKPEKIPFMAESEQVNRISTGTGDAKPKDAALGYSTETVHKKDEEISENEPKQKHTPDKTVTKTAPKPKSVGVDESQKSEDVMGAVQPEMVPVTTVEPEPAKGSSVDYFETDSDISDKKQTTLGGAEKAEPVKGIVITDMGKTAKATANEDRIEKYVVSGQDERTDKGVENMFDAVSDDTLKFSSDEYTFWRGKVDSLEMEYGYVLSIHKEEIEGKSRMHTFHSAAPANTLIETTAPVLEPEPSPPYLEMANAYFNLANITRIDGERTVMLLKLKRLVETADSSAVKDIEILIDSLESLSK